VGFPNSEWCADTLNIELRAEDKKHYLQAQIPNVISPDGDGINDVFRLPDHFDLGDCVELFI